MIFVGDKEEEIEVYLYHLLEVKLHLIEEVEVEEDIDPDQEILQDLDREIHLVLKYLDFKVPILHVKKFQLLILEQML